MCVVEGDVVEGGGDSVNRSGGLDRCHGNGVDCGCIACRCHGSSNESGGSGLPLLEHYVMIVVVLTIVVVFSRFAQFGIAHSSSSRKEDTSASKRQGVDCLHGSWPPPFKGRERNEMHQQFFEELKCCNRLWL